MTVFICPHCGEIVEAEALWPSEQKVVNLLTEKKRFKTLQEETGLSGTGLSATLKRLTEKRLIVKVDDVFYSLSKSNSEEDRR